MNVEIVSTNSYIRRITWEREREREISSTKFENRLRITHFIRFLGSDGETEGEKKTKVKFVDRNPISITESESLNWLG